MKKYKLENLDCVDCAANLENKISGLACVKSVKVVFATQSLIIDTTDINKVEKVIKDEEPDIVLKDISQTDIGGSESFNIKKELIFLGIYLILFTIGAIFMKFKNPVFYYSGLIILIGVYFASGKPVIIASLKNITKGKIFDENFLMTFATVAAFFIGAYTESVAVMLFYKTGEFFQNLAVNKSRRSIKALMEIRPDSATVLRNGKQESVFPDKVSVGEVIVVRPGEKVPLDGEIIKGETSVDLKALTGESVPKKVCKGELLLAGSLNISGLVEMKVTKLFGESSVAQILDLVENAAANKAKTERFITVFARYYTPAVFFMALFIAVFPPLLNYGSFTEWIYRALVVLVVSCPCALVISVPLGYFGGIGAASRQGILIKGANYLEALAQVKAVAFDKTGTLTKGVFKVTQLKPYNGFSEEELLYYGAIAEWESPHPIAQSIKNTYSGEKDVKILSYEEIPGYGVKTLLEGYVLLTGNDRLLHKFEIPHGPEVCPLSGSIAHVAVNGVYAGYIIVSDEVKPDTSAALDLLKKLGVEQTVVLTGDNMDAAKLVLKDVNIDEFYANLLPEDKAEKFKTFAAKYKDGGKTLFAGDGINDAPVIALADVGVAMGAAGTDAAMETADVVIMNDSVKKIADGIKIARKTKVIIWQNIIFALSVKGLFVILGFFGIATMWEAVFGDIGVALLALFNSMRIILWSIV